MHLPFTPNHVLLISACYPDSAALLNAGPDYSPNGQELSRLTYYAANRPGKITKLASELEKRALNEARRAKPGNARYRASLLITLAIFKALVVECRREISLLSHSTVVSVNETLGAMGSDLEVAARAANLFNAWTTYTDGHLVGVDGRVTEAYISCLRHFARLSTFQPKNGDTELRNRTRLVGLGALTGTIASEALYNASSQFKAQVDIIMDALISNLHYSSLEDLDHDLDDLKESPASPDPSKIRNRPIQERRAASIHVHIDGEEGPTSKDVVIACLRALSSFLAQANATQVSAIMQATFDSLDQTSGWDKPAHCNWLALKIVDWAQYQYRYAVPSLLVERLLEMQDAPTPTPAQSALCGMITTVFTSPSPIVNLSTSDTISNFITLILRRINISTEDGLLPDLVECIAALGTHVYYADQIQDLAGELISRLLAIEASGIPGRSKDGTSSRSQAIRCLLIGLVGLTHAADKHVHNQDAMSLAETVKSEENPPTSLAHAGSQPSEATIKPTIIAPSSRPPRRAKVEPEVWQDTLTLLCDGDFAVRSDYVDALITFIHSEVSKQGEATDSDGVRRIRPLATSPLRQASHISAVIYGDLVTRLLNALHAYLFILATSESLGHNQSTRESRVSSVSSPPLSNHDDGNGDAHEGSQNDHDGSEDAVSQSRRSSKFQPRSRKLSMAKRIMQHAPPRVLGSSVAASASDYSLILSVLTALHEQLPVRGLVTGVPMLLALEAAAKAADASTGEAMERLAVIQEVIARTWLVVGKVWDCAEVTSQAEKALGSAKTSLPTISNMDGWEYHGPREPTWFSGEGELKPANVQLDVKAILVALASSQTAQDATGMDEEALLARLSRPWSPDTAIRDVDTTPGLGKADGPSSHLKVAPALMHIENLSLASLARPSRGFGVTDLREALSGRSSMSATALVNNRAPSVSTMDHGSSLLPQHALRPIRSRPQQQRKKVGAPNEVRDVLNKLGIGKSGASGLTKPSVARKPENQSTTNVIPPYQS